MATPHVTSAAALLLEKNRTLNQAQVETILKSTALPIAPGATIVYDLTPVPGFYPISWGANAVGAGVIQLDAAISATP
jgi:subtilisin family serine protease